MQVQDKPGTSLQVHNEPGTSLQVQEQPGTSLQVQEQPEISKTALSKQLKKQKAEILRLKGNLRQQKKNCASLRKKMSNMKKNLSALFTADQMKAIGKPDKRSMRWGNETVKKALQLRFGPGSTGYRLLQEMNIPLPDIRTPG